MPKTLTPVSVFPSSIPNFPLAGAGEPVAIGPLESAVQAVLNRTEHLHTSRQVVETTGVRRIQRVVSLTALQNLAGMADGDTVDVEGYGRYRLYNPSALTADGLWILTATGGGRWVHTAYLMRGASNAWAMLDSGGRLAQDVRDASILTQHIANQAVTSAKLAPGSVVGHLGYTPLNKAGDIMTGPLNINNERLFNVFVSQHDTTVRYYYLGRIESGSGILKINGILGGHTIGQGRANVDLQFAFRDGFRADGYIMGTVDRADVLVRDGGDGWAYVYLVTKQYALVNLELSSSHIAQQITYDGTYSTSAPSGTTLYQLSDDFTNNTHPNTLKMNNGVLQARYDHANRFSISEHAPQAVGISPGGITDLAIGRINVPAGKSLYIRRVRYMFLDPLRLRIGTSQAVWTASNANMDADVNFAIFAGSGTTDLSIVVTNVGTSNQTLFYAQGVWVEFEIR
ncbi:hypothetical protein [uncultured Meiothermus sp.]|uniref:hypothetical protein n=1 Tax=uncultured Meiothermus sp. TaxID=157471 RepID=UPI002631F195|nr:hypothetical protein [uncultured Meiothermus sp.]